MLLMMVPKPCLAVMMLFPHTKPQLDFAVEEEKEIQAKGQVCPSFALLVVFQQSVVVFDIFAWNLNRKKRERTL